MKSSHLGVLITKEVCPDGVPFRLFLTLQENYVHETKENERALYILKAQSQGKVGESSILEHMLIVVLQYKNNYK